MSSRPPSPVSSAPHAWPTDRTRGALLSSTPEVPLRRHGDFLKLWAGQTISELGTQVSVLAIPLTAVVTLHADAFQAGLLGTAQFLPFLVVGLPAGVWVDRLPRRPLLVAADVGRCLCLGSIPAAAALGHLTLLQLYAVSFAAGFLTVVFDVAYQSYLPFLVATGQLVQGNARLQLTQSSAEIAGPGLGGVLVGAFTAPVAVATDAASYLVSVASLLAIRRREPRVRAAHRSRVRSEIAEGLRFVVRHRLLLPIAVCTALSNLFGNIAAAIVVLYAVRDLHLSAAQIGLWYAVGSVGGPLGALLASRLARRLGLGPAIAVMAWTFPIPWILVPLAPASFPLPVLIASGVLGSLTRVAYNVNQVSLRQAITPRTMLGRMNASVRFLIWGTIPLGSFAGGALGSLFGLRPTLWAGAAGLVLCGMPVTFSPVRRLRAVEEPGPAHA